MHPSEFGVRWLVPLAEPPLIVIWRCLVLHDSTVFYQSGQFGRCEFEGIGDAGFSVEVSWRCHTVNWRVGTAPVKETASVMILADHPFKHASLTDSPSSTHNDVFLRRGSAVQIRC